MSNFSFSFQVSYTLYQFRAIKVNVAPVLLVMYVLGFLVILILLTSDLYVNCFCNKSQKITLIKNSIDDVMFVFQHQLGFVR